MAWILDKHKKPFSDSEKIKMIKESVTEVMDTMFEDILKEEMTN